MRDLLFFLCGALLADQVSGLGPTFRDASCCRLGSFKRTRDGCDGRGRGRLGGEIDPRGGQVGAQLAGSELA